MDVSKALTDGLTLMALLSRLEPSGREVDEIASAKGVAGALSLSSREDPGRSVLYVVATGPPAARGDNGMRWLRDLSPSLEPILRGKRTNLCTVVFPGSWPTQQLRHTLAQTPVRLVSAVHPIWADRLRVYDAEGNVDSARRAGLLERLGGSWSDEDERRYTAPAVEVVDETGGRAEEAKSALLDAHPSVLDGGVTVVFGPGGIGKTFLLRRIAHRMAREAVADPLKGIPIFAALPLLLHEDALETWISRQGVRLPIADIQALLESGVIVPILDALDELVRGQAREGSRQFLQHLKRIVKPDGRVFLSSRDYYLNLDPLVQDELSDPATAQLKLGFFSKTGRRRYVQMRTGLDEQAAARWAGRLEEQAQETLKGLAEADVESLIGHPLFLDAFCQTILSIDAGKRVAAADQFRITSPDVFGEIVEKVLDREHGKVKAGWDIKFGGLFAGPWEDPFTTENQLRVFTRIVLMAAADGGREVIAREADDPRYRQLRHGVFTFTRGVSPDTPPREALRDIVSRELGRPQLLAARPPDEEEALADEAVGEFVSSLLQHTLADTRPGLPGELVFAPAHRAYFDFLLAAALLAELQRTLTTSDAGARESFIQWCLEHHIFERLDGAEAPFATCLDFALWHRTALLEASAALDRIFEQGSPTDEVLASYVLSLALAVAMRAGAVSGGSVIRGKSFAPREAFELDLMDDIVPNITNVVLRECSFPQVGVKGISMRDVTVTDSDAVSLSFGDSVLTNTHFEAVTVSAVEFSGALKAADSTLDFVDLEPDAIVVEPAASISLRRCRLSRPLMAALSSAAQVRREAVELIDCTEIEEVQATSPSSGRIFINRLMSLVRKHGHREYAVWEPKLRGLTKATGNTFPGAIAALERHGAVDVVGEMVCLTDEGAAHMYSGKGREGHRSFNDVESYWLPIIEDLDAIL